MDLSPSAQRRFADSGQRSRVEDLLSKYPYVDAAEAAEILHFMKKGPPLEVGLMTTVDSLKQPLDAFRRDHARHFELGLKDYLLAAAVVIALIAICVLLNDSGIS
jgi:hypothetical protein